MNTAFEATNPFEFWTKANMAAVEATLELFKATTTAATSMLSAGSAPPSTRSAYREAARPSYETLSAEIRGSATTQARVPANSSTGRSWYRSPYRSPFDPLFWMTPGHPVDHVGDWMRPAMAAGAAFGNPFTPPFATPFSAPFAAPLANPMPDWQSAAWQSAAWMSPMTIWANMMPNAPAASSAADRAHTNVVDFETAYSTYRTSGGHASAQILGDRTERRAPAPSEPSTPTWGLPFMMFGWPPRFG